MRKGTGGKRLNASRKALCTCNTSPITTSPGMNNTIDLVTAMDEPARKLAHIMSIAKISPSTYRVELNKPAYGCGLCLTSTASKSTTKYVSVCPHNLRLMKGPEPATGPESANVLKKLHKFCPKHRKQAKVCGYPGNKS